MNTTCPVPKILLPVDGSENSRRAVEFAGCIGSLMGKSLTGITLVHVIKASYLGKHTDYVDFRSEIVKQSDTIKKIRKQHIEKNIRPFINDAQRILTDKGVGGGVEQVIAEGDPAEEIVRIANEGNFSTIMMARHGDSEKKDFLTGLTGKVVHAAQNQTVYVVGSEVRKDKGCPVPRILVPVDGSTHSMKGVEHAACLAGTFRESLSRITLIRVINTDRAAKKDDLEKEARQILDASRAVLLRAGVSEKLVTERTPAGKPADEIIRESEEGDYNLIILGRKGRSKIKDMILGGVSAQVIQRCIKSTVAVVSSS